MGNMEIKKRSMGIMGKIGNMEIEPIAKQRKWEKQGKQRNRGPGKQRNGKWGNRENREMVKMG